MSKTVRWLTWRLGRLWDKVGTISCWLWSLVWAKELLVLMLVMGVVYWVAYCVASCSGERATREDKSMSGAGYVVLTNGQETTNAFVSLPMSGPCTNGATAAVCMVTNGLPFRLSLQEHVVASSNACSCAFVGLFSADAAVKTGLMMIVCFFLTWLVGGGVLVSVLVGRYNYLNAGHFRKWRFLHRRHIVVLGWDDGAVAEVVKAMAVVEGPQPDCYVVTRQDVSAVEGQLRRCGVKYVWVYKGDYDDMKELERLRWRAALRIILMGERKEDAHDARVKMFYERLKAEQCKFVANIDDFGLANELGNDVINFHKQWADGILKELLPGESRVAPWLVIVGSGAMGQAVALCACKRFGEQADILIVDDDKEKLQQESNRFGWEHPDKKKLVTFDQEGWRGLMEGTLPLPDIVVVAKKKSEKGMSCLLALLRRAKALGRRKTIWALGQEIIGDADSLHPVKTMLEGYDVWLFGMRCGCKNEVNSDVKQTVMYRNPDAEKLRQYAERVGSEYAAGCGVPGAHAVLGGALAYDAALRGNYDIDMRLLVPGEWTSPETQAQIGRVMDWLVSRAKAKGASPSSPRIIDEGGKNYIQHVKWFVKVPGIGGNPDVELSWNVQAETSYCGIAAMAKRFPRKYITPYVCAKWRGRGKGKESYDAIKQCWRNFVMDLIRQDGMQWNDTELNEYLRENMPRVERELLKLAR